MKQFDMMGMQLCADVNGLKLIEVLAVRTGSVYVLMGADSCSAYLQVRPSKLQFLILHKVPHDCHCNGTFFVDVKPTVLCAALYFIDFTALMIHLMLLLA